MWITFCNNTVIPYYLYAMKEKEILKTGSYKAKASEIEKGKERAHKNKTTLSAEIRKFVQGYSKK